MLTRLLIHFAYLLKASSSYQQAKKFAFNLLEDPRSRLKRHFDLFMILLVMMSVFLLIYEINNPPIPYSEWFENIVVVVFITEYILRAWLYSDSHKILIEHYERTQYLGIKFQLRKPLAKIFSSKLKYIFSPYAIIDLLAILPSYRPLRILRIFLVFRLFKLVRYSHSVKLFTEVLANKRFELFTLAMFIGFWLFISSTAIYMFENEPVGGQVRHLFDALYWSVVTMSTVGYGDITPQTPGGRIVALTLIIIGVGVLSFFTSIIVTAFTEKMEELRENRTFSEVENLDNFIIICGYGRVGQEVAKHMEKDKQAYVIIDNSEENFLLARRKNCLAIKNDASKNEVLLNAGINKGAKAVLCTTGNDVTNVYVTLTSRHLNSDIKIISRANRQENIKKLKQVGADFIVQPFEISGLLAAEYVGQPVASQAIFGIINEEKNILMETILVPENSEIENVKIKDIDFEKRRLILIGVISNKTIHCKRNNRYKVKNRQFYFNPADEFILQAKDILVLLGRKYSIDYFKDQIERSSLTIK
jgi:voltage-gated potassium channel